MKKFLPVLLFCLISCNTCNKKESKTLQEETIKNKITPEELSYFIEAYPDITFTSTYDQSKDDYKIEIKMPDAEEAEVLYWCEGRLLPEEELVNKDMYWKVLYDYPKEILDPEDMTEEQKEQLKAMSSSQSRRKGPGSPMFIFDIIYNSKSQKAIEPLIKNTTFLKRRTRIHKRIETPLKNVENKIIELSKKDEEVKKFYDGLKSSDAYYWRLIDGTNRKSFHSLGVAIDVIPKRITGEIFWSWAKDHNPSGWMVLPLSKRWIPPLKVISIFESEGFIWGGKWAIWDNMHFEYHPELILYNGIKQ
ncbi:M15 family metallopeptidase [Treponema sp.]|uniref:M15 family metallopeptidase n=1 Tax=Treponema sp. TaxID=166 RepID=UPI0025ED1A8C|nr:M15 family metallopeptidase [Treponema sp.]MCR5218717.1 M15 family metallopeptidase [Treponema sp.]